MDEWRGSKTFDPLNKWNGKCLVESKLKTTVHLEYSAELNPREIHMT